MGALSGMPKQKPFSGPMSTQPVENRATVPTEVQPGMPTTGRQRRIAGPKMLSIKTKKLSTEKAQLSRQGSLRKQREAQKTQASPK
jgi:hypothetical protein